MWGTLLVIPIDESLLYVRPLYLRSSEKGIPELKRVIVVHQSQIVMGETLNQALIQIFGRSIASSLAPDRLESVTSGLTAPMPTPPGTTAEEPTTTATQSLADLASQANLHMERANKALKDGDLATFGEEYKKLSEIIQAMGKMKK